VGVARELLAHAIKDGNEPPDRVAAVDVGRREVLTVCTTEELPTSMIEDLGATCCQLFDRLLHRLSRLPGFDQFVADFIAWIASYPRSVLVRPRADCFLPFLAIHQIFLIARTRRAMNSRESISAETLLQKVLRLGDAI
jgi:hypothetical protein